MYNHRETIEYINYKHTARKKENGSQLTDSQELKKTPILATLGPAKDNHQALTHDGSDMP